MPCPAKYHGKQLSFDHSRALHWTCKVLYNGCLKWLNEPFSNERKTNTGTNQARTNHHKPTIKHPWTGHLSAIKRLLSNPEPVLRDPWPHHQSALPLRCSRSWTSEVEAGTAGGDRRVTDDKLRSTVMNEARCTTKFLWLHCKRMPSRSY